MDTSTTAPTDGQALVWNAADSEWQPGTIASGGGAVTSVNGETGVVSLGVQEMDDFELNSTTYTNSLVFTKVATTCNADGQFRRVVSDNEFIGSYITIYQDGSDSALFSTINTNNTLVFTFDDGSTLTTTYQGKSPANADEDNIRIDGSWPAIASTS